MADNIRLFDQYAAAVLARLYQSFPVKASLDVRQITGHDDVDEFGAILAPDGRPSREAEIAYATIQWLADTGTLRVASARSPYGFQGVVLTASGLDLLKATPNSLKESTGDKLARLVREGAWDLAREAAAALIKAGIP